MSTMGQQDWGLATGQPAERLVRRIGFKRSVVGSAWPNQTIFPRADANFFEAIPRPNVSLNNGLRRCAELVEYISVLRRGEDGGIGNGAQIALFQRLHFAHILDLPAESQ